MIPFFFFFRAKEEVKVKKEEDVKENEADLLLKINFIKFLVEERKQTILEFAKSKLQSH